MEFTDAVSGTDDDDSEADLNPLDLAPATDSDEEDGETSSLCGSLP